MSGMMNDFYYTGESIANVGKDVTQFLGKSGDLLINKIKNYALFQQARMKAIHEVADREKKILEDSLTYFKNLMDSNQYFDTIKQLRPSNLLKKSAKIVDKAPNLYIKKIPTTSTNFLSKTASETGNFLVKSTNKIIKVLPIISSTYNGYEAVKRFSEGEIIGGTLKAAESVVNLIPGLNFAASITPTVINLIYDFAK